MGRKIRGRRCVFVFLLMLLGAGGLSGCWGSGTVDVGFVASLTGKFSDLGVPGRNGAQLAVEKVNAEGGIHGARLNLVIRDDESTVQGALAADIELLGRGIHVIIGHMTSTQTSAALPEVEKRGGVLVSPTASSQIFDAKRDGLFRVMPSDSEKIEYFADYIFSKRKILTMVVVWDESNSTFAGTFARDFQKAFSKKGGHVALMLPFKSRDRRNWLALAVQIKAIHPEGLLIVASPRDTAELCQALERQQVRVPLFGTLWCRSQDLVFYGGRTVEGMEVLQVVDMNRKCPKLERFKNEYRQRFGKEPTFASLFSYDAVLLVAEALKKARKIEDLKKALVDVGPIDGLTGPFRLDAYGDRNRSCFVERLENGRFVRVSKTEAGA